jgi:hypothetical protein
VLYYLKLLSTLSRCGLLSYTRLLSLAVRLGVTVLGCVSHPGNLCPLKAAVQTGGPSRRRFRVRGRILAPQIPIGGIPGSPVAGVPRNELGTLGGPLLPTFVYIIYMLIRG